MRPNYGAYVSKVLKQVTTDKSITEGGRQVINAFVLDMFERIVHKADELRVRNKTRPTLASKDIEFAVKLLFPAELARYAVQAGNKAIETYNANHVSLTKTAHDSVSASAGAGAGAGGGGGGDDGGTDGDVVMA